MMRIFLKATPIADFQHPAIRELIASRGWHELEPFDRIGAVYRYVRDEIPFGYNRDDALPASEVLRDGYGQCNTKGNLLVALLWGVGVPARFHGFTIEKDLQRGAIPAWLFPIAPRRILHSWVEVRYDSRWIPLEGFIIDRPYLESLQRANPRASSFCGYGVATPDLHDPPIKWRGEPTFIQRDGIAEDFGVFDNPDDLYSEKGTNLRGVRRLLYERVFRHAMNARIRRIRDLPASVRLAHES